MKFSTLTKKSNGLNRSARMLGTLAATGIWLAGCSARTGATLGDSAGATLADSVWRGDSQEIAISYFSYFEGGSRFRATREMLTDEQLGLLSGFELTGNRAECFEDTPAYGIEVRDADGTVRTYEAAYKDSMCDGVDALVSFDAVAAFASTYECLQAGETRRGDNSVETAPTVGVGDGCEHGFFDGPRWVRVNIEAPGSYSFRGVECAAQESGLELYSGDGTTLLNSGQPEAAPGCWVVEHDIDSAGVYLLRVDGTLGDYFVRIDAE